MKETRTLRVTGKRFSRVSLQGLAQMFLTLATELEAPKDQITIKFVVSTQDGVTYESEDPRHFEEGAAIDLKQIESVQFGVSTYRPSRSVSLTLSHGDSSYGNKLQVSGDDERWVHGTFSRLQERLQAIEPSHSWFTRHPRVVFHIMALILGFSVSCAIKVAVNVISAYVPPPDVHLHPADYPILEALGKLMHVPGANILWFWVLGAPYASWLRDWIAVGYPSIDLNLGPATSRVAEIRRGRIAWAFAFVIVPMLVNLGYDLLKTQSSDATTSSKPRATAQAPK